MLILLNQLILFLKKTFESKGFALIYSEKLYIEKVINRKLDNEKYFILHPFLKNRTEVKLYNPDNSKFLLAKVKNSKKIPIIFNSYHFCACAPVTIPIFFLCNRFCS